MTTSVWPTDFQRYLLSEATLKESQLPPEWNGLGNAPGPSATEPAVSMRMCSKFRTGYNESSQSQCQLLKVSFMGHKRYRERFNNVPQTSASLEMNLHAPFSAVALLCGSPRLFSNQISHSRLLFQNTLRKIMEKQ